MAKKNKKMTEEKNINQEPKTPPYPNWKKGLGWGLVWGFIGGIIFFVILSLAQMNPCTGYTDFFSLKHLKNSTIFGLIGFFACLIVIGITISFRPKRKRIIDKTTYYILLWYGPWFIISFFIHIISFDNLRFTMDSSIFIAVHIMTIMSVFIAMIANASYFFNKLSMKITLKSVFKGNFLSELETPKYLKFVIQALFVYTAVLFIVINISDDFINTNVLFSACWMLFIMYGGQLLFSSFERKRAQQHNQQEVKE